MSGRRSLSTLSKRFGPVVCIATVAGCGGAAASAPPPPPAGEAPQLVVLLVADQLSYDLYDRYQRQFRFGLKTLRDGGTRYRATHDHGITETAPGHATLATGVHPARHGIPSNDWWGDERWVYAVEDDNALQVGDSLVGRSPELLRRDGLGVWLQEAHPDARVVSVSAKDRSAVLMAGRANADAYWFEPLRGRFVTSTHFRSEYPAWVDRFHEAHRHTWLEERIWVDEVPPRLKRLSRADTSRFEGNGARTFFPHRASEEASNVDEAGDPLTGIGLEQAFFGWWATTPMLDRATFQFALAAVEAGGLGADDTPDLLALSISQTDRVGHAYGPHSREQFDNLLRLDAELGEFLAGLDRLVGEGRWVVAFTSDHGIFPIPEYADATMGMQGSRFRVANRRSMLDKMLEAVRSSGPGTPVERAARAAESAPSVERAWTESELEEAAKVDSMALFTLRSSVPGRLPYAENRLETHILLKPGTIDWPDAVGTMHGSPYLYDREVPLLWYGPGRVQADVDGGTARAIDVAPTLARLLGIAVPSDLDGRALPIP